MKPEAQRIAIAEFCGWKFDSCTNHLGTLTTATKSGCGANNVPDYLNDLNAMHEAELTAFQTPTERCDYLCHLENVASRTRQVVENTIDPVTQWACFATATQRAEALLRTIGKWTE